MTQQPDLRRKKELFVDSTHEACLKWEHYNQEHHDIWQDPVTTLWGVYRKPVDRTIRAPLTRHTRNCFKHYRRPIVVTLTVGDMIQMRLKGRRAKGAVYTETIDEIFEWMAHRAALRAMAAKRKAKADRKKSSRGNTSRKIGG